MRAAQHGGGSDGARMHAAASAATADGAGGALEAAPPARAALRLTRLATFSGGAMYSMVMPTIWEFMREDLHIDSKPALGVLLSIYPALQVAGFLVVGRWSDRRGFRAPYLCCQLLGILGGVLYGVAAKWHSLPVALSGRALLGAAAASNSLAGAYIARTAPQSKVVGLLALNQGCNLLGVMLGPAINLALLPLDVPILGIPGLYLNPRTAAGWLAALVYVGLLL